MAPGEGLSNEDIYMASWYDDLLKRQEYEAIQGRPTFKPNAFQEMFTPKGMEYQWQGRPDEGGGEYTGEQRDAQGNITYEGDTQDLRMVRMPTATPTVPDGTQASPVVTPSPPLPIGFDGERSNSTLHGFLTATRPSPFRGPRTSRMTMPGLEAGLDAAKARAVRGGWIAPEADPKVVRGTTRPTVDTTRPVRGGAFDAAVKYGPRGYGGGSAPVTEPVPEPMDRTRGRWSRWNRWGGSKPVVTTPTSARVAPGSADGMPLESRTTPRVTPRVTPSMAEPFVPAVKYGPGGYGSGPGTKPPVSAPRLPVTDASVVPPRPTVTETPFVEPSSPSLRGVGGAGNFFREGWLRRNIPEHVRNLGHTKTAAFLRGLNPAAWALTGADLASAAWGDPTGLTERQGLAAQRYSGNELIDINAQRAMQGLPPLQGQGAGEEGMQDFTEYFIDSRNYGGGNWVNPASYWWDKMPWNNPSPITGTQPPRTRTRR